ncbi:unnamed protein product [Mycena citricolor]|uniref:Uncharacterized protein n=1 Tax=Mycena citricolor TaxID=2018698 RepID=A0AAD2GW15_9AGAR|nr:unnamed protein product [Mycena citricolor]
MTDLLYLVFAVYYLVRICIDCLTLLHTMNPSTIVFAKGVANVGIGLILFWKPVLLYESSATKALSALTGLGMTNSSIAPGFNHSIACLVASVGLGSVVAARSGPAALPAILAMTSACTVLSLITCAFAPVAWGVGSATLLLGGLVNAIFSLGLYLAEPRLLRF